MLGIAHYLQHHIRYTSICLWLYVVPYKVVCIRLALISVMHLACAILLFDALPCKSWISYNSVLAVYLAKFWYLWFWNFWKYHEKSLQIKCHCISCLRQGKDTLAMIQEIDSSGKDVVSFYLVLLNMKKPNKGETMEVRHSPAICPIILIFGWELVNSRPTVVW